MILIVLQAKKNHNFMNILEVNSDEYRRWRDRKLSSFTSDIDKLMVEIKNPRKLSTSEISLSSQIIKQSNLVFFQLKENENDIKSSLMDLAGQFGMGDFEILESSEKSGLTKIEVSSESKEKSEYVPYTNKALNWHTDGYYSENDNPILSWLLYCQSNSSNGGENSFMDHEIAYILFNDESSAIDDLMSKDAFTIPANVQNGRRAMSSYVFRLLNNKLHMKFSMREKNIIWSEKIISSVDLLKSIIRENENYQINYKLSPNQGVISNNVIHMRSSFTNTSNKNRLLYRLRSKKRISI